MKIFDNIRASLQFTEVSFGCFGFSITLRRVPKPQPAPAPRDAGPPWLYGVGGLLLGAALATPDQGGRHDTRY